jgi:Spy/CpxP family protein refolding chaperone
MFRHFGSRGMLVVGLGLVVAMAQPAWAQRGGGGGRGFGRGFGGGISKARLATLDEVQADLKLSDEQKTKITEISDDLRQKSRDLFGGGMGRFAEIRADLEKLNREASAEVDKALDDAQRERLQQIDIQVNGAAALNEPNVIADLKLSDEQQKQLDEARAENEKVVTEAFQNLGDMSRDERREKFREIGDAASERLLGVLTPEQKTQFEAMKGETLEIDRSQLRPGFGGGRRGGGNN